MENLYMAMLRKAQEQHKAAAPKTVVEGLGNYGLDNVNCPICGNKGYILSWDTDKLSVKSRDCDCMNVRRSLRNIKKSGMEKLLGMYTMDGYIAEDELRKRLKQKAKQFISDDRWMFISGIPGSGKTHLCTAICSELIKAGNRVRYMLWRDISTELKANVNLPEYAEMIRPYKSVDILYIDDFFKGGVSDADIRLAYELINARYNDKSKRTIISSQLSLNEIMRIDDALASRIYERSRGFYLKSPKENMRLRAVSA